MMIVNESDREMSSTETRTELDSLREKEQYESVLSLLAEIASVRDLDSSELVIKGRAIQLTSEDTKYSLAESEKAFMLALSIEPEHIEALEGLGWYYYAVEDDAKRALPLFERGLARCRRVLTQLARGYAGCLSELDSEAAGAQSLRDVHEAALLVDELGVEAEWLVEDPA